MLIWTFILKSRPNLSNINNCTVVCQSSCIFLINFSVIGHSLGAALATHATAHLIKQGYKIDLLETYGSPRVGDRAFSNWYQTIFPSVIKPRVTHGKDPVPHLPPKDWGFVHLQTEVFYAGKVKDGYKICNDQND